MKKIVDFALDSDVMTGGVKLNNNFLISTDYISGAVLRAGFANMILLECPFYNEEINGRKYIVAYRGDRCGDCDKAVVCKKFSDMYFSFLFPKDTRYSPLTMKLCKAYGTEHPVKDIIASDAMTPSSNFKCHECEDVNGRIENMKGLINIKTYKQYKVQRSISTHTAINYNTRTIRDNSLFQIDAIKKGQVYSGIIDDKGSGLLAEGLTIYAGKYSSNGYGKLTIKKITDYIPKSVGEKVKQFNSRFNFSNGKSYAAILFLSDAKIFNAQQEGGILRNDDYLDMWKKNIFGRAEGINIEKVFAQNFTYRGYDTSSTSGKWQKQAEIHTQMGSSFLISYDNANSDAIIKILEDMERNGVGKDTEVGYGQIEVCSNLHMIGVDRHD